MHRERSSADSKPWLFSLQKLLWSSGRTVWWHMVHEFCSWQSEQVLAVAAWAPAREQAPCIFVQSWKWFSGFWFRRSDLWQTSHSALKGAFSWWQATHAVIR
jgi:hypothetical protein